MHFDEQSRLIWPISNAEVVTMLRAASDLWVEVLAFQPLPLAVTDEAFKLALHRRNLAGLEHGRRQGWWSDYTAGGPAAPLAVNAADFAGKTMAHIMAAAGLFKSVSDARRNGWDKPVTNGVFKVGKRTLQVR